MVHTQKSIFKLTKYFFILFLVLIYPLGTSFAQSLDEINASQKKKVKTGMLVLGSWSLLNLAYSPIAASNSSGQEKYFHEMNGYWNLINLGLAGSGLISANKTNSGDMSLAESLKQHNALEKTLLFNAGLDLGYIAGGFYLKERALNVNQRKDMLSGFGKSIILQGAFLFVFDISFYLYLKSHDKKYLNLISGIRLMPNGMGLQYRF